MENLYNLNDVINIHNRINDLTPASERAWGKMRADQMLAHCAEALRSANDETHPPRMLIGRIIGPFLKKRFLGPNPLPRNLNTDKNLIIAGQRDFNKERIRLKQQIDKFYTRGEEGCTKHPHFFFGVLTPQEWSIGMWKHLDHHLRQFNM